MTSEAAARPSLRERLGKNADGILEQIARDYGVSTFEAVERITGGASSDRFRRGVRENSVGAYAWGPVVFIVHTPDIVLECEGPIPPGTFGRGYFNLHGDSPIGGHIKAENCKTIAFVMRPFMGRESRSIQFFNAAGEAIFKIFVRRDEARELIGEQVKLFDELKASLAG